MSISAVGWLARDDQRAKRRNRRRLVGGSGNWLGRRSDQSRFDHPIGTARQIQSPSGDRGGDRAAACIWASALGWAGCQRQCRISNPPITGRHSLNCACRRALVARIRRLATSALLQNVRSALLLRYTTNDTGRKRSEPDERSSPCGVVLPAVPRTLTDETRPPVLRC